MSVTAVPIQPLKKGSLTKYWAAIALVLAVGGGLAYWGTNDVRQEFGDVVTTASGLRYKIIEAGEGPNPTDNDVVLVSYKGMLKDGMSSMDVLRATFPAGTLTGAPKVHAMELIDQLEPVKRGIYGGACGYLSFAGDMDVAIAIRTGIVKDNTLYVQAAAGVVADSVPEMEWLETEHKARALLRASELVEGGLE